MDPSTLDNITAYGSLATPVVLAVFSVAFLFLRLRWEAARKQEEEERAAARQKEEDERAAARKQEEDERAAARQREEEERAAARQREEDERAAARKQEDDARARVQQLEDEIRGTRIELYEKVLAPFIDALNSAGQTQPQRRGRRGQGGQAGVPDINRQDFRRSAFRLSLFADDDVVRAFNDFMQFAYEMESSQDSVDPQAMLATLGRLLLAIRRSVGNADSSLSELEMLKWLISDIKVLESEGHR